MEGVLKTKKLTKPSKYRYISFMGGNDNRVNASIEKSKNGMDAINKTYTLVICEGAGHVFFRAGEVNIKARKAGIKRLQKLLSKL